MKRIYSNSEDRTKAGFITNRGGVGAGSGSDDEESDSTISNDVQALAFHEAANEETEVEPFVDLMELKCVDTEPPFMMEDPTLQLLDVTNYEEV